MFLLCLFVIMAGSLNTKAQQVSITLSPGWTWISYTKAEAMDISLALGDFVPMEGDMIKAQDASAIYNNGRWRGNLHQFAPGIGYVYYSMRSEPVSLVFYPSLTVTTNEPTDITGNSATCGGNVSTNDGSYTLLKGVCWATHENPIVDDDAHTENDGGANSFSASMTGLSPNTVYYVRVYAISTSGIIYGDQKTFTTLSGIPVVSTASITNILGNGATCGGMVAENGGLDIIARGVCWSTIHNPTVNDSHTSDGTGLGGYSSVMVGMNHNTTYYVRAYASNSHITVYGEEVSFTTHGSSVGLYVDLGLPSGTLWATCNVGADDPEDYGDYFAWGETQPKDAYSWSNYQHCNGSYNTLIKYCNKSSYGYNGFTDNLTTLLPEDDAATANWGADWRMPTKNEWMELYQNTTHVWTTRNGIRGRLFVGPNGNSIFLPAAGGRYENTLSAVGSGGNYWSSSLYTTVPGYSWYYYFSSDYSSMCNNNRYYGRSVRAVRSTGRK